MTQMRHSDSGRHNEELSRRNEEIRDLARVLSHDIRTPLVNIKGFSGKIDYALKELREIMKDHMSDVAESTKNKIEAILDKDIPESLGFIDSSAGKIDKIINSFLDLLK